MEVARYLDLIAEGLIRVAVGAVGLAKYRQAVQELAAAEKAVVALTAGARLSPAQQAVFDEVKAIPNLDCEQAMLIFQRRLPGGRVVGFGGRCHHYVWVHEGKVLDPTGKQYLERWPKNLLDREPGLEQAIRSGVFTPEQHATFMSRVSGEKITAADYLQGPR